MKHPANGTSTITLLGGGLVAASGMQAVDVSTTNFATFSELAFQFTLTPAIGVHGVWVNGRRVADTNGLTALQQLPGKLLRDFAPA